MPQRLVLQGRHRVAAHHPGKTRDVLKPPRIALVGHRRGTLLPRTKFLLHLAHLGAGQVAELDRELVEARRDERQHAHQSRVAIALNHLGRRGFESDAEAPAHFFLHLRLEVRKGAHGPGDFSDGRVEQCPIQPISVATHLGMEHEKLQTKGRGLRVNAVGAARAGRVTKLEGATAQDLAHPFDSGADQGAGIAYLEGECGVEHITGGHPMVQPARRRPDALGHGGQERDDVVAHLGLDLGHPGRIHRGAGAEGLDGRPGNRAPIGEHLADGELDIEPGAILALLAPDRPHLGSRVALDHESPTRRNTYPKSR